MGGGEGGMNPVGETSRIDYQGLQVGGQLCLSLPVESSAIGYLSHGELSKKGFHREQTFKLGDYGLVHSRDKSLPEAWLSLRKDQVAVGPQPHCLPSPRQP